MPAFHRLFRSALTGLGLATAAVPVTAALPTSIHNTATLTYRADGAQRTVVSNTVSLDLFNRRPTTLSFHELPAGYIFHDLSCQVTPTLLFTPSPVTQDEYAASRTLDTFTVADDVMIVLDNQGGNHDPSVRETSWITVLATGHPHRIPLLETGPDTGIFAGAFPGINVHETMPEVPCDLAPEIGRNGTLAVRFAEDAYSFSSSDSILIDPTGYVFDSRTGEPVDGAQVDIVDAATGQAAKVYAEDGVSDYPSTVITGQTVTDGSGHQYQLSKGNYRFPLLAPGRYKLKIAPPKGYVAPSVVKPDALAKLPAPGGVYTIIDASYGGVLTLAGKEPIRVDVPLDGARPGNLVLDKIASLREASPGDFIQYQLSLTNKDIMEADNITISDMLPVGLRYRPGSARSASGPITQPVISGDGRRLTFTVPVLAAGVKTQISYVVSVAPGAPIGDAVNHASASGAAGASSNEAAASVRIKSLLFTDALTIVGRVTQGQCGDPVATRKSVAGVRLLLEDGTQVVTDRDGLYHIEGVHPGTHVVQLDTASVPPTLEPVSCDIDTRQAHDPISRFVEGLGGSLQRADFLLRPNGKVAEDGPETLPVAVASDADAAGNRSDWLARATPGVDWMFPLADHNPRAPALRVVIRHAPGQRVALTVNGAPTDPLAFDGTDEDKARGVAVSTWTGLPLGDRDNVLEARVLDAGGHLVTTLTRTVHYANAAAHVIYVPEKSRLVADGLTRPLLAIRVTDREGKPVRAGTLVPFRVDQPYSAAQEAELQQGRQLAGIERGSPTARVVGDDGLAFLALQPTTQAGAVHVVTTLRVEDHEATADFKAWLAATQKDWVMVGFGRGTFGYAMLKKHSQAALPGAADHGFSSDGQIAFFAKGRIKGSWLLTVAYDTDKKIDADRGLLGTIDPDRYYTVYGDGTQQTYDAATRRKLYVRLERREFYALFGDYTTGFTDTKLGRYDRTLNGVKADYQGRVLSVTAFAAHDDQRYGRDEIQGNGLSGPYRLSASTIVANSDQVTIETRDRFRSEKIIDSKTLTRHIDYDIDPDAGTIRFREPILSRDANLDPIFIVVDYETYGTTRKLSAGARVLTRLFHGRVELGATALRDETISKATVAAVDLKVHINHDTELRAEAGTGGRAGISQGQAFSVELEHHDQRIDILGYAKRQDDRFGLGQQNFVEAGTQKGGFDGRIRLTSRLNLIGSGWYQKDLDGPAHRYAGDVKLEYKRDHGTLFVGAQLASDTTIGAGRADSRLLSIGGSQTLFHDKVQVTAQTQVAIGGAAASVDFPVRHVLDIGWRITPGIRLIGGEEIADGAHYTAHSTRIGFDVAPWSGAKLLSTLNQQAIGENGPRTFAQYGLSQSLPLGRGWSVDASVDASSTVAGHISRSDLVNPFQPVSSGTTIAGTDQSEGDYKAISAGATYRARLWSWNGRAEYRISDTSRRWGVTSNLLRTLGEGKTIASSMRVYKVDEQTGGKVTFASADLALAIRPLDSHWSLLERLELRHEGASGAATSTNALAVPTFAQGDDTTTRVINNVAVNWRSDTANAGHGWEANLYYGVKYVRGRYSDDSYAGVIDVIGAEIRKDISSHVDLGLSGSVQHAWSDHAIDFSGGPSVGVSPGKDMWITVGYNVAGYRDHDYQDSRYTRQGPYVTMRLKFNQQSLRAVAETLRGAAR